MIRFRNRFVDFCRPWHGRFGARAALLAPVLVTVTCSVVGIARAEHLTDTGASKVLLFPQAASATDTHASAKGGLMELLPNGPELGAGWNRQLDLLIDPTSSPDEFFPPDTPPGAKASLRTRTRGKAYCQARYTRDDFGTFEAWLTRHDREEDATAQWNALRNWEPRPGGSGIGIRRVRVGETETVVHEGALASTVWARFGPHMLALILLKPKGVPDEFFKVVDVFLGKLTAPLSAHAKVDGNDANRGGGSGTAVTGKRVIHAIGDLYVSVEDEIPRRVHLSAPRYGESDGLYYFAITNAGDMPIVLWNVRVQRPGKNASPRADDEWETISSDYPSCASGIPPGTVAEECVSPPQASPWRVCFLYTKQSHLGESSGSVTRKAFGEYELISEPILQGAD
jgi:hypothetical protein